MIISIFPKICHKYKQNTDLETSNIKYKTDVEDKE